MALMLGKVEGRRGDGMADSTDVGVLVMDREAGVLRSVGSHRHD